MDRLKFGQVWVWRQLPNYPLMYIGPSNDQNHASFSHRMMTLPERDDTSEDRIGFWSTILLNPENWTLLEDVDDDQEG